ncbi:MAG: hypothetical protein IT353_02900 [Gemmatimonadaceae bacterium]|nr:hypothetical protein [Gemmatimonadaceae bacterium]
MLWSLAAGLGLVALAIVVLWATDRASTRSFDRGKRDREDLARARYEVKIGDPYSRVLPRQGTPDTVFRRREGAIVIAYWAQYKTSSDVEKAFVFGPDSVLKEIWFFGGDGTLTEYGWVSPDGVGLGMDADSLVILLGKPCKEEVEDVHTLQSYPTNVPGVLRVAAVGHGERRVEQHGWTKGTCP